MTADCELSIIELNVHQLGADTSSQEPQAKDKQNTYDYEDLLNLIGFGWAQWQVLAISSLLLMQVINETMGVSYLSLSSQCEFSMDSVDKAIMGAAAFVGIFTSSYFWGYLSDTGGRRHALIYSATLSILCSFASMFAPNYWSFVALRFFTGLFIAGNSSTTYAFLGEFSMNRHRAVVINYASMFVGLSMAYTPAVAWFVLSMDWSLPITEDFVFRPWRILNLFNLLPGLIAVLLLLPMPESPKFLLSLKKDAEAMESVNWLCVRNTGLRASALNVHKLKNDQTVEQEHALSDTKSAAAILRKLWQDTLPLFQRPYAVNYITCCFLVFGSFLCSSGFGFWYAEIQNRMGASHASGEMTVCEVIGGSLDQDNLNSSNICVDQPTTNTYIDSIVFGLSYVVGYVVLGIVINPIGRKHMIFIVLIASGIFGISLQWIVQPIVLVLCFCLFLMLPGLSISMYSGALVDLVPTHLRGKAVCICLMLGRIGSVVGSNVAGALLEAHCVLTFGFFSGYMFLCAALTLILPI